MKSICLVILCLTALAAIAAETGPVNITHQLPHLDIVHNGKSLRIRREPDNANIIDLEYALTSRPCPPYCIQPMRLAPGVETIGELDVIDYIRRMEKDKNILIIDSREYHWLTKGMIPTAIHIPWQKLHPPATTQETVAEILQFHFGAIPNGPLWDFEHVKTLILYCNGPWCGQSPTNIRSLLALGYPPEKIKWYRGGMQSWLGFGLTTVKPEPHKGK